MCLFPYGRSLPQHPHDWPKKGTNTPKFVPPRWAVRLPRVGGDHFHCTVEPSPGHIRCRFMCFSGQKKAHKHNFFGRLVLGFLHILHSGSPANPGLSLGQTRGRPWDKPGAEGRPYCDLLRPLQEFKSPKELKKVPWGLLALGSNRVERTFEKIKAESRTTFFQPLFEMLNLFRS